MVRRPALKEHKRSCFACRERYLQAYQFTPAHLSSSSKLMASLGIPSPTHNQCFPFDQLPLLHRFFPRLAPATSAAWSLLTGSPSTYGQALCIGGSFLLFGKYALEYIEKLLETYFCQSIRPAIKYRPLIGLQRQRLRYPIPMRRTICSFSGSAPSLLRDRHAPPSLG